MNGQARYEAQKSLFEELDAKFTKTCLAWVLAQEFMIEVLLTGSDPDQIRAQVLDRCEKAVPTAQTINRTRRLTAVLDRIENPKPKRRRRRKTKKRPAI